MSTARTYCLPVQSPRVLHSAEVVLAANCVCSTSADLWHLRLGHLSFSDMCKLKTKATGIAFTGEPCFCQTCIMAKMKRTPFQSRGEMTLTPK